ncbi:uncharacterized protein [Diabrotica undecimpunctata]|uniref:uncharacterized protein n=1 Tax=Diabrotica undecimpunctata TaxID=50387 RepID=UPI003B63A4A4
MIDEDSSLKLSDTMHASAKTIFKHLLKSKSTKTYPPELKSFALTLNFYSPKAYLYVRKTFPNMLHHLRTLQKWYQVVACEPRFQKEAVNVLKHKVVELRNKGKSCICALMVDEMSIHQKIEWDGEKFLGYVDIGSKPQSDSSDIKAKEAIVFLINSLNHS